uniref:NR LBD domain-containing protein n=1 Tax=Haemonchus placei TaxID=6290 RepID=A0A0N4WD12_HAEPC
LQDREAACRMGTLAQVAMRNVELLKVALLFPAASPSLLPLKHKTLIGMYIRTLALLHRNVNSP